MHARRNSFTLVEFVIGMAIVSIAATLLVVEMNHQRMCASELRDQRAALREIETVVAGLQSKEITDGEVRAEMIIKPLEFPFDLTDQVWVRVLMKSRRADVSLTALVSQKAMGNYGNQELME